VIGLDTNVMVRYLTEDDPLQSAAAARLIDSLSASSPGFISLAVVVELVWVLQACYCADRDNLAQVLEKLLRSRELVVEQVELAWQALHRFSASRADFADCLIERTAHAAGCDHIATFDRQAAAAGMKLIS
jgi:predicted nucleic-acid-binding protein